ncbi:DUF3093 domain-containing protein [Mycobacterium sp.]|uniref:DUF3093 domain-containing protein n=1 Tax=Mycobacterium sp. TaxID=1785 RepID=UPI0031DA4009
MSGTPVMPQSVRYSERLWVPWWWWPLGFGLAALIAVEVNMGVPSLPRWLPFAALFVVAAGALLWLGRIEVRVSTGDSGVELQVGEAHLPVSVISRSADIPRSAKSAALGRQLDPAAYVVHRGWVGPMVLVVLDDADDPTPYWLVSTRHPERVLSALRS